MLSSRSGPCAQLPVIALPSADGDLYTSLPMQLRPALTHRTLAGIGEMTARVREDLRIVEEQISFQLDVVEDAKTRMLVSETPLADRAFRLARDDLGRMYKERARLTAEITRLVVEQDRVLDRMLD
ncbi:hypothetical protein BH20ACT21_BH20ACT21_01100 [soil metagenome]